VRRIIQEKQHEKSDNVKRQHEKNNNDNNNSNDNPRKIVLEPQKSNVSNKGNASR
jgi:hypothetical protein